MPSVVIAQGGTPATLTVVAAVAGKVARCKALQGALAATGTLKFQSSGSTALTGTINLTAGQQVNLPDSDAESDGWFESLVGEGLQLISSGAGAGFNGSMSYQYY